jgi:Uma2 family endonuclease
MTLIGLLLTQILPDGTREWFAGDATLVWLIDPQRRVVEVWRREGLTQTLGDDDTLSGEEVLPGFAFPVRELWE